MSYDVTDFQKEVIEESFHKPVVVDFWAEWCGPCRILGPMLERLARENDETWKLAKVNTEVHPDVALRYQIRSIPNVKLFVQGKVQDEFVGALPEPQVRMWLKRAIPSRHRKKINEAQQLMKNGKQNEARILLEEVVAAVPEELEARILLAQVLVLQEPQRAAELLAGLEEPRFSDVIESVRTLARLLSFRNNLSALPEGGGRDEYAVAIEALGEADVERALQRFIQTIRTDRYYDDDGARKACIAIFQYLGEAHPLTQQYRRDFSSALY
jgi:putative thioredoxin